MQTSQIRGKSLLLKIWKALPEWVWLRRTLLSIINQNFTVGVLALVRNSQGQVLLVKHTYRKRDPWGLPGGYLKKGEQPDEALRREIAEEIGLNIVADRPLLLHTDTIWGLLALVFDCVLDDGQSTPSAEVSEARFFDPIEIGSLVSPHTQLIAEALRLLELRKGQSGRASSPPTL